MSSALQDLETLKKKSEPLLETSCEHIALR